MNQTIQRATRVIQRSYLRATRSPFADPKAPAPLLVHCCHHKAGTVWIRRVLESVGPHYGWKLVTVTRDGKFRARPGRHFLLDPHSMINREELPPFRGSHMIRDPRDMVISAYFYHLKTAEAWVHLPRERFGGRSYQEYLNSFDKEEGMAVQIRESAPVFRRMSEMNYSDPRVIELRYEDHISDEEDGFNRLFRHYGFSNEATEKAVDIALSLSLNRVKSELSHIRSGKPNEWSEHFTPALKALFKEETGDAAFALGYEDTPDW